MKPIRIYATLATVLVLALTASAQNSGESNRRRPPTKKSVTKSAIKKESTDKKLSALQESVAQQQAAQQLVLDQLKATQQQLQQTQQQLQATQEQLTQTQQNAKAAERRTEALESAGRSQEQKTQSALAQTKATASQAVETAQKADKRAEALEHPSSIAYKGVRFTPGGFFELTQYYRSHATLSDLATPFQAIPLEAQVNGGYNSHLHEYGISARSSRITLRADADAGKTKLTGYFELDFNSAASTANPNQTTSYTPRIRQGWGRVSFANGWSITGGQDWTLLTLNRKGVEADNSALWIPNSIEAQYSIGYDWGRFGELRISKTLGKGFSLAFALDNPSYLSSGANSAVSGLAANGNGGYGNSLVNSCSSTLNGAVVTTTCTNTPTYSTNLAPDLLFKVAYDNTRWGHYEIKSLGRIFRDRVVSTPTTAGWNNTNWGGGIGGGAIVPLRPKKIDFIAQGFWGKGVSRYQDAGQYDFVVRASDHGLQNIEAFSVLSGFETHPTPKIEFNAFFGDEYYARSTYLTGTTLAGYGSPTAVNSGCYYETAPSSVNPACTGNNRNLWNAKAIAYYDLYKGSYGVLRYGLEFDYVERSTWSGANGLAPKGNEKIIFSTIRYILP